MSKIKQLETQIIEHVGRIAAKKKASRVERAK